MKSVFILVVLFVAWFGSFCLDCYWYGSPLLTGKQNKTHQRDNTQPFPDNSLQNIFWFLQISDIHVSVYYDEGRYRDLATFIKDVVTTVQPAVVFVTGDITDAKTADQLFSTQHQKEWTIYESILNQSQSSLKNIPWIDIRGNHDAFDVPWKYHKEDMYRRYALSSHKHTSTAFKWSHKTSYGVYSFVGVDACPSPGFRRPYNFFGVLHKEDLSIIEGVMKETKNDNLTILLAHYPSAFIAADFNRMRKIFSDSVAYLCGHLHSGGYFHVHEMYAPHPDGHLELELSDWKYNRKFRLLAIDHDILSFTDTSLHQWPVVLVTNPVNNQFTVPGREPIGKIIHSTHIRILVFSPWSIDSVMVSIDGSPYQESFSETSPLYTLPWQPSNYLKGQHILKVIAKDKAGHETEVNQKFSLDGTKDPLLTMASIFLLTNHLSLLRMTFFFLWITLLVSLITSWYGSGFKYFHPLTKYPPVFYPWFFTVLYFGIGPWYVAEVMKDVYGLVFVHGIMTPDHFVLGALTYFHGFVEILTFHIPVTLYLAHLLQPSRQSRSCRLLYFIITFIIAVFYIKYHIWGVRRTIISYRWTTAIISPGYFWSMILAVILVYLSFRKQRLLPRHN